MSTFDYAKLHASAVKLIVKFGRDVTFIAPDPDTATAKPWRPDTATSTDVTFAAKATFIPPSQGVALGMNIEIEDLVKRVSEVLVVATQEDLTKYTYVQDGTRKLKIEGLQQIKPGDSTVLWMVGVKG